MKRQPTNEACSINPLQVLVVGDGYADIVLRSESDNAKNWYVHTVATTLEAAAKLLRHKRFDAIASHISPYNDVGLALPSFVLELYSRGELHNLPAVIWCSQLASNVMDTHARLAKQLGVPVKVVPSLNTYVAHDFVSLVKDGEAWEKPLTSNKAATPSDRDLAQALLSGHGIRVVLQPQIDLKSGRIVGAEALARWSHPVLGVIPPSVFVPLANKSGLNVQLFHCVEAKVIAFLRKLKLIGLAIPISVNASADTLCSFNLTAGLEDRLKCAGIQNSLFKIELTEDVPVADMLSLSTVISWLRLRSFHVSMDDFGCGTATLAMLIQLPFSELKIDGQFVREMSTNQGCEAAVVTAISLARAMNLNVVAEGVETGELAKLLLTRGCLIGQGYGLFPPLEKDNFILALSRRNYCTTETVKD